MRKIIVITSVLLYSTMACGEGGTLLERNMLQKAKGVIGQMTVDEKISQLMNDAPGIERLGIKPYNWWSEGLHGVGRNGRATVFPQPIGLGATFDPALVRRIGDAIATEGRAKFNAAQKINNRSIYAGLTYWAPNVNIFRDPRWGRGMETYGEDPYLSGMIGTAYVKGMQGDDPFYLKAGACAKHFAVHSGPEKDRHSFDVYPTKKDLYETYLPAFRMLVQDGKVEAVMGAYNRVYGESASGSKFLLTDILRSEWGFKGHIVSDCGAVTDIYTGHHIAKSHAEAAAIAIKNGLNLECGNSFQGLKEALDKKLITEDDLDKALLPLIMTRLKLGILFPDDNCPYNEIPESVIACDEHAAIAREAAQKSMVLLKNNDVLPLDKNEKNIYVLGPYAADAFVLMGNYFGLSNRYSTYLQGIVDKVSNGTSMNYKLGFLPTSPNINDVDWALIEAKSTQICIVVMGNSGATEGEEGDAIASPQRGDRNSLSLPKHQIDFLRKLREGNANKIITILTGGSPIDMKDVAELSDAVVMAWYPGQEGGLALGDLLFGDTNFSGRLPVTFPLSVDALPEFDDYTMKGRTYKYMEMNNVMYPFGYGLSYGKVTYGNAKLLNPKYDGREPLELQVVLQNESKYPIEEVAQVYLAIPHASIDIPLQTLIGFQRVELSPFSTKEIKFVIQPDQLKMIQEDGTQKLLKGEYVITVSGAAPCGRSDELGVGGSQVHFKL